MRMPRTTPRSRAGIVCPVLEEGWSRKAAAAAFGICIKTIGRWIDRFLAEGLDGLKDRSSRPHRLRKPTPLRAVARNRQPHPPRCKTRTRARPRPASADPAL